MTSRIPPAAAPVLTLYLSEVEARLPGLLKGFYLHGSIALDAFHAAFSDIDFIAVLARRLTPDDLAALDAIHHRIEQQHPRPPMQGSYLTADDLGKSELTACPHYTDGVLHASYLDAENNVTWWLLKHRAVTLVGRPAGELDFSVDWARLIAAMRLNLNTYWARYTREPARIAQLLTSDGVQWAVLGVLRQYYSFEAGAITSKLGAGEYALEQLPARWNRIIQEAINIRQQQWPSLYASRVARAADAFAFMRFIIRWCNVPPS